MANIMTTPRSSTAQMETSRIPGGVKVITCIFMRNSGLSMQVGAFGGAIDVRKTGGATAKLTLGFAAPIIDLLKAVIEIHGIVMRGTP
ncbi:hypothetical protein BLA39750_00951 [Burkholderia lata]|uniref:Uncharacterized protein n=1 Tax=Burkholderia lata (strain ATCC 17760 / DSM 23089 / LMG 22485 / NCIMB 9086 / R18194 / 383) TaxID=482957 RepID=A0A6P2UT10_BURL3|nr:hypothetical protein [Burkholderia lata]VWC77071.1 hypothetical protein BLA39750_00951 [Burkholderia lata]